MTNPIENDPLFNPDFLEFKKMGMPGLTTLYVCVNCAELVSFSDLFCRSCGTKNVHGSEERFFVDFGEDVNDFHERECKNGHPWINTLDSETFEVLRNSCPFCHVCGRRLV